MKNKKFASFAMGLSMLTASVMIPTQANAALGLITGNFPLFVVGAVVTVLNSGVAVTCVGGPHFQSCGTVTVISGVGGLIGLLLMDGEKGQNAAFSALTAQDAAKLGLKNAAQVDAYNHELAEINAVREDIMSDLVIRTQKGEQVKGSELHARWMDAKAQGMISSDAFAVVEAVSAQAAHAFESQR